MWIFGYGSLLWRTEFPFVQKLTGYVTGYVRRFYWWSEDHRGVPGAPGRVVNLLQGTKEDRVWGIAYQIDDDIWENSVRDQLDFREKGGYTQKVAKFHPVSSSVEPFDVTVYIGDKTHRQYAGPAPVEEMAQIILTSRGPSGPNKEYLYQLARSMREIAGHVEDDHLFTLEQTVKQLEAKHEDKEETKTAESSIVDGITSS